MAGDTILTIIGNLTADPELRFTPNGVAVANFTVASTPRSFDKASGEWRDGITLFQRCTVWRDAAENVAESLTKGARVIVSGRLEAQEWEDKQTHEKRHGTQLLVDEVGPSLRYARAKVQRVTQQREPGSGGGQRQSAPQGDPWSAGRDDEPPF